MLEDAKINSDILWEKADTFCSCRTQLNDDENLVPDECTTGIGNSDSMSSKVKCVSPKGETDQKI